MTPFRDAHTVGLAASAVRHGSGRLAALGLGSCVAVILYDADRKVGGLAHVVLPSRGYSRQTDNPTRFAAEAPAVLVAEMERVGAVRGGIGARIVGGAAMFRALDDNRTESMGSRNVAVCREALAALGIPVTGEDVGADYGRSVVLDVADGSVTVRAVGRGVIRV